MADTPGPVSPQIPPARPELARRNRRMLVGALTIVAGMVGLSFAAVPLYRVFCKATGFGGTTQVAERGADRVVDRTVTVRFDAEVNRELPWQFRPLQNAVQVKLGEVREIRYHAKNLSDKALVGTATFNVTPDKAGIYFNKIQCFCFTRQRLEPGQELDMPVTFFVDPALADDPHMKDVATITLSYTFFLAADQTTAAVQDQAAKARPGG
ncbi:cytochrome c oxidase assembly protein [Nitrospirillum viridazoti]|nr:cytochrome c oxidase assembly protein [Nitrospirillum amazonense]TWB32229.1 cytochrome c oxidase assembly protein subunit 11 [Nitrospirillum amazonense]